MILEKIIDALAVRVAQTGFVSKSGGLLREVWVAKPEGGSRKLPAAVVAGRNELSHFTPDDSETAMTWWEASATRVSRQGASAMHLENDLRFFAWLNTERLRPRDPLAAELALLKQVRDTVFDTEGSPVRRAIVQYLGDDAADTGAFSTRFGFDEAEHQMLLPPFKLVAMRFKVSYSVALGEDCDAPISVISKTC